MKIYLATDHAGYALKEEVKQFLEAKENIEVEDCGAHTFVEGDGYPEYMALAAKKIQADAFHAPSLGIIFGGSGVGEAIVANRFAHVRAVVYAGGTPSVVKVSREHNDTNVLSIGARFVTSQEARHAIEVFLETAFSHDERHVDRIIGIEEVIKN
jgi:ribose 5-phosphate isomerase B